MTNAESWKDKGNTHIDLDLKSVLPYHEKIAELVIDESNGKPDCKILDLGCGLGQIESLLAAERSDLQIDIADAYESCLTSTASNGNVRRKMVIDEATFDLSDIEENFYDIVIMSHLLEHLIFPVKAVDDVLKLLTDGGILIVAVPNPVRPSVFITNLFKIHYVNRGHVHAWDPSHWRNFLENTIGCQEVTYHTDFIQLPRATRSLVSRKMGKFLVNFAPWWGFSNIAVVTKSDTKESAYSRWKLAHLR